MIDPTAGDGEAEMVGSSPPDAGRGRPRLASLWILSAWCGLVAGLVEVGTIVLRKQVFDPDHLYKISRHFVWLIPLSNLCVFSTLGLIGCVVVATWPRRGRWLFSRGLCALAMLPALLVALPRISRPGLGGRGPGGGRTSRPAIGAARAPLPPIRAGQSPGGRRHRGDLGRMALAGRPGQAGTGGARPLPAPGSPNVLLIVMDSVAAGHLALHGYERATSTTLGEVAERGIRFESARAACSWTLPSHATMFTGRWMHELSVGWLTPLDASRPTLAEYLGDRGYATAGFVANLYYCAADSGLSRGFTHYRISSSPSSPR